jgi:hypothetical protein
VLVLNVSLTFENVWPTPWVTWRPKVSVELAALLLALVAVRQLVCPPSPRALALLSASWVVLIISRYADETAPALYGRDVNLYWDLQYVPDVAAMLARAAPFWLVVLIVAAAAAALALLYAGSRWALGRVAHSLNHADARLAVGAFALSAVGLYTGQSVTGQHPETPMFATPITATWARQASLVIDVLARPGDLPPSPDLSATLSRVRNTDVLVMFLESYGAVTFDQPEFAARLADSRALVQSAVRDTGRQAVSAFVESPTFGGSSWLAHLTLMSGIRVRDPHTYARLMTQDRESLVTTFARAGHRTLAIMPGLWYGWPEGRFYGFDDIYGGDRLDYHGPDFGWWGLSDQFALARFDERELSPQPRKPLFVFFPTVSTHTPFVPTAPYQPDWPRLLTATPFDPAIAAHALEQEPDWLNLGPSYIGALSYSLTTIAGYLRLRPDRDFILILLGDHQPPAAVAGEGARWDVPVHVIAHTATSAAVLNSLAAKGFKHGLTPEPTPIAPMHKLTRMLLDALSEE